MRSLIKTWTLANKCRSGLHFGIEVDRSRPNLTNLRFADDIVLVAASRSDIIKMITHLRCEAEKFGLKVHLGKTKILTNCTDTVQQRDADVCGDKVHVVPPGECERYLGKLVCLEASQEAELKNRIGCTHPIATCSFQMHQFRSPSSL